MNKYKITIDGNKFDVTVQSTEYNKAHVEVNGIAYDVSYENKSDGGFVKPVRKPVSQPTYATPTTSSNVSSGSGAGSCVKAPLPGTILNIKVNVGDNVKKGDVLMVMEAMKMENDIMASSDGQVKNIHVAVGQTVAQDDKLIDIQ